MTLNAAYDDLQRHYGEQPSDQNDDLLLTLPSKETANSVDVMNSLAGNGVDENDGRDLHSTAIGTSLSAVSGDLDSRWRGALYALHPQNPDAARHFCTSAREVMTGLLESLASDEEVRRKFSQPEFTPDGKVTRRTKVKYLLSRQGVTSTKLADFVETDISNVIELFKVFNGATHGEAGRYELSTLKTIKGRVEDGIVFLTRLSRRPS
jgi:hypothetical protein